MRALLNQAAAVQGPCALQAGASSSSGRVCPQAARSVQQQRQQPRRRQLRPAAAAAGSGGLSYKDAGVDIDAGNELVKRIQKLNPNIGGFSGMVPFGTCARWDAGACVCVWWMRWRDC